MKHALVIGAGPSGIVATKELKEHGFQVTCFEATPHIGGAFAAAYDQCQLTSSTLITPFSDFEDDDAQTAQVWTAVEYLAYLDRYIDHFQLRPYINLNTAVTQVIPKPNQSGYSVTTKSSEGELKTADYEIVAVCTGTNRHPKMPTLTGQADFNGEIIHASQFVNPNPYVDKRVLIIGAGESGSDISLFVAQVAKNTAVSIRHTHGYLIPRYLVGAPTDIEAARSHHSYPIWWGDIYHRIRLNGVYLLALFFKLFGSAEQKYEAPVLKKWADMQLKQGPNGFKKFGTKNLSLIRAIIHHQCEIKPEIDYLDHTGVVFKDGRRFDCDAIICATGYQNHFPFLKQAYNEQLDTLQNPRQLYKHCIHPEIGSTLFFCGFARPAMGAIPPISEMQARWLSLLAQQKLTLPSTQEMAHTIEQDYQKASAQYGPDVEKIKSLVNFLPYLDDLAHIIGCFPDLTTLYQQDKKLWHHVIRGPIAVAQYRLNGPGAKHQIAKRILYKLPIARKRLDILLLTLFHRLSYIPRFRSFALTATWPTPQITKNR